jgi:hypothetical protein
MTEATTTLTHAAGAEPDGSRFFSPWCSPAVIDLNDGSPPRPVWPCSAEVRWQAVGRTRSYICVRCGADSFHYTCRVFAMRAAILLALALLLAGCGGGGGGSNIGSTPAPDVFPTPAISATFSLPALAEPPLAQQPIPGVLRGSVSVAPGEAAPPGVRVELIDATIVSSPTVLAAGTTDSQGRYQLPDLGASLAPVRRWIRAQIPGMPLRAFARPIADVSPGTEAAVLDIMRIVAATDIGSRLSGHELQQLQELASLHAEGLPPRPDGVTRASAALQSLFALDTWTRYVTDAGSSNSDAVPDDIGGLWPLGSEYAVTISETINSRPNIGTATFLASCERTPPGADPGERICNWSTSRRDDLSASFRIGAAKVIEQLNLRSEFVEDNVLRLANPVPWIEFPPLLGTRVLYENRRVRLPEYPDLRAYLKVTRRTYPIENVQALGRTVRALRVVMDYEMALLNIATGMQADLLERKSVWLAPTGGPVRVDVELRLREGMTFASASLSQVATFSNGGVLDSPRRPIRTPAAVIALPLEHRHATYSAARDVVYVAVPTPTGGAVLEKDPASLQTLRQFTTPAVPGRLAVSSDGARLYVGLDGGTIAEYRLSDLAVVRSFSLPPRGSRGAPDRVAWMSVDPLNAARILAVGTEPTFLGGTPELSVFLSGALLFDALAGEPGAASWSLIHPSFAAWSTVPDEFVVTNDLSPASMYRLRATAAGAVRINSLDRASDTGFVDLDGTIITQYGRVLNANSLDTLRQLTVAGIGIRDCAAVGAFGAFCGLMSGDDTYVLLDKRDGGVMGVFSPQLSASPSGCAGGTAISGSLGIFGRDAFTDMGGNRVLLSGISDGRGNKCTLQSWRLIGQP